jgi:hypothetical protein
MPGVLRVWMNPWPLQSSRIAVIAFRLASEAYWKLWIFPFLENASDARQADETTDRPGVHLDPIKRRAARPTE